MQRFLAAQVLLLLGLIASSCKDGQKEILGTYVGKTNSLVETITLLPDGVFTQTIGIGSEVYTNSGQWSLKANGITFREVFLVRHDTWSGKILFPPQEYSLYRARWKSRIERIVFDVEEPEIYFLDKKKNSPQQP